MLAAMHVEVGVKCQIRQPRPSLSIVAMNKTKMMGRLATYDPKVSFKVTRALPYPSIS